MGRYSLYTITITWCTNEKSPMGEINRMIQRNISHIEHITYTAMHSIKWKNSKNYKLDKSESESELRSREISQDDAENISAVHRISSISHEMPKILNRINQSEDPEKYLSSGSDT